MAFSVGRQEQRMPMFTSREDQIAASGLCQEMSELWRKTRRDWRRRMEMMQVKPPRAKTIIRAMRWRLGSWSWLRKGRGRMATRMSVIMFTPALVNLVDLLLV